MSLITLTRWAANAKLGALRLKQKAQLDDETRAALRDGERLCEYLSNGVRVETKKSLSPAEVGPGALAAAIRRFPQDEEALQPLPAIRQTLQAILVQGELEQDLAALASFFKRIHRVLHYGLMVEDTVSLPPREGEEPRDELHA